MQHHNEHQVEPAQLETSENRTESILIRMDAMLERIEAMENILQAYITGQSKQILINILNLKKNR
jgi:hypothetical protein